MLTDEYPKHIAGYGYNDLLEIFGCNEVLDHYVSNFAKGLKEKYKRQHPNVVFLIEQVNDVVSSRGLKDSRVPQLDFLYFSMVMFQHSIIANNISGHTEHLYIDRTPEELPFEGAPTNVTTFWAEVFTNQFEEVAKTNIDLHDSLIKTRRRVSEYFDAKARFLGRD